MDLKNNPNNPEWEKKLDEYLNNLLETSKEEANVYRGHMKNLKEISDALDDGTALDESTRIIWRECYADAIEMWSEKKTVFERDARFSAGALLFATTLRECLVNAIYKMEEFRILIPKEDFQESLTVFLDFIEKGSATPEQYGPIIRYLAHVAIAISDKLKPYKVKALK